MNKSYKYTILFMMAVAFAFTLILATVYGLSTPKIKENQLLFQRRAIMYAFNIKNDLPKEEVNKFFEKNIVTEEKNGVKAFKYVDDSGNVKGIAFPFEGPALWGQVKGYLALDPNMDKVQGITFTEQSETPGLGGRIDELPFKEQFRGLVLPEGDLAYGTYGDKKIDAITGATLTSGSVIKILNQLKTDVIMKWGAN